MTSGSESRTETKKKSSKHVLLVEITNNKDKPQRHPTDSPK